MTDTEGVIRFAYALEPPAEPVADEPLLSELAGWWSVLKRLGVIGQTPARYGGLGFGNVSGRDTGRPDEFVITASQTAGVPTLTPEHLVRVTRSDPARFWVDARGRQPPSSETLTHAMVYRGDPAVNWVFHGHSPEVWERADALALPATGDDVVYGSPAMADAVRALLADHAGRPLVFVTAGHRDGVFACGATADATGSALVGLLARSLA